MVRKLMKYEFLSIAKSLTPMSIILIGIAALTRFVQIFENYSTTYAVFKWSSITMFVIACIVMAGLTVAVCTVRFYKNMYSAQGYLTLTLPVTHNAHVFAKLFAAVITTVVSSVVIFVAFAIATMGDVFAECMKAVGYIEKMLYGYTGANLIFYNIEVIIAAAAVIAYVYTLFYACITVGQLAKKNRVLAAFGAFFAYYIIKQILGTLLIVFFTVFPKLLFIDDILRFAGNHPCTFIHLFIWFIALLNFIGCVIFYIITKHILVKKLNIE